MSEKRFKVDYEVGVLDTLTNEIICDTVNANEVVDLLNEQQATNDYLEESNSRLQVQLGETLRLVDEQQATIEELRLQEKEKGVPVFVVREGKNPVALFFNEQRASLYCQENMAHLTYQQEKWCRVE